MDKVNKIGLNLNTVKSDLQNKSLNDEQQASDQNKGCTYQTHEKLDPDNVMDYMKQQGDYNYQSNILNGAVESKSIKDSMQKFAEMVPPDLHNQMLKQVESTFKTQFPNINPGQEFFCEVVDNLILESLMGL